MRWCCRVGVVKCVVAYVVCVIVISYWLFAVMDNA